MLILSICVFKVLTDLVKVGIVESVDDSWGEEAVAPQWPVVVVTKVTQISQGVEHGHIQGIDKVAVGGVHVELQGKKHMWLSMSLGKNKKQLWGKIENHWLIHTNIGL